MARREGPLGEKEAVNGPRCDTLRPRAVAIAIVAVAWPKSQLERTCSMPKIVGCASPQLTAAVDGPTFNALASETSSMASNVL
jgi:hypothetical protein